MKIIDTHADTLLNVLEMGPEVFERRRGEAEAPHINRQAMEEGDLGLQVLALFACPRPEDDAVERAEALYAAFGRLMTAQPGLRQAFAPQDVEAIWKAGKRAVLLSIEGGEAIGEDAGALEGWYARGLRGMGLCWNHVNALASGVSGSGGLSDFGHVVVAAMETLGIWVDVSHLNEQSFWDTAEAATRPIMASHSNAWSVCAHPRNLKDEQIRCIVEQKGYIGINLLDGFINKEPQQASVADVIAHMRHILELGGEEVLGFGCDLDGIRGMPKGLCGAESYPVLLKAMQEAGFGQKLCEQICHGNFLRYWGLVSRLSPCM